MGRSSQAPRLVSSSKCSKNLSTYHITMFTFARSSDPGTRHTQCWSGGVRPNISIIPHNPVSKHAAPEHDKEPDLSVVSLVISRPPPHKVRLQFTSVEENVRKEGCGCHRSRSCWISGGVLSVQERIWSPCVWVQRWHQTDGACPWQIHQPGHVCPGVGSPQQGWSGWTCSTRVRDSNVRQDDS